MPYKGSYCAPINDGSSRHWEARRVQNCVDRATLERQSLAQMGLKQPTVLDVYRNRPSTAECVEPLKRSAAPDEFVLSEKWQSRVGPVRFPQRDNYCSKDLFQRW
ncbi:uncharacterized protein LOC134854540 isoform X2 [Symsagittifera roscoffensis]|uniref:uncharacterized protein LOC134854540 isoform X2 n=1 Tax=Symsagittifera roscoffensis TaxID=84072 RepID=UPI00307B87B4